MSLRRLAYFVAAIMVAVILQPRALSAQTDLIRGKVVGPDGIPIEGVRVTATSIPGNLSRQITSKRDGSYQIVFPNGTGDYFMGFAAIGYQFRQFEVKRITGDEAVLVADARMAPIVIDTVTVVANVQQRVDRNSTAPDIGGTERTISGADLPLDLQGNLAALAASLPGVLLIPGVDGAPDGFSVLGLGADQNSTTLNGMAFDGSGLPRDASVSTSLTTSPYDVSKGGFSGGQLNVRSSSGSNFLSRGMSLVVNTPQLMWTDRAGQSTGNEYTNLSLGGVFSGPIKTNEAFYNVSYQLGRRSSDLQTLLNTDELGLSTQGVALDSVNRLLDILDHSGIPVTVGGIPSNRLQDNGSLLGTFSIVPLGSVSGRSFTITANGGWTQSAPTSGSITSLPSNTGEQTSWNGGMQASHSEYLGLVLSETSVSLNASRNFGSPYLTLPGGRVRVSSTLDDGASGVSSLSFGGNQGLSSRSNNRGGSFRNALSWFSDNNKHRVQLTTELSYSGSRSESSGNLLGSFSFNSLADLEAGIPASFSRQLTARNRNTSSMRGAISLGDSYRRNPDLSLTYGIRIDGSMPGQTPLLNPEVESVFGVRNDYVPRRIYISPRIGFSKTLGTSNEIAAFLGAAPQPRSILQGGIGIQQGSNAGSIGNMLDNTGLPSGIQQINCVGAAAPVPDWDLYATNPELIPTQCADGSAGTVFSSSAPNVSLFSKDYAASKSLRSNLKWSGRILHNRFSTSIEGTYSLNLNQQRTVDLNFRPDQRFELGDEQGRPVFVQPTSIVTTTGAIASRDARVSQSFNRVNESRSDIRTESRQLQFSLSPVPTGPTKFRWNASYVLQSLREQVPGFTSTVGNPLDIVWGKSYFTHQISYGLNYDFWGYVRVGWNGSYRSGIVFTPGISGDVNGDGSSSNDRAFVFNPATTTDPALASAMQGLLDGSNPAMRSCLQKQLGALSARNSCRGPWYSTGNLSISLDPIKLRMPSRARIQISVSNPLGAADLLVNGSGGLKGWGQQIQPEQTLLYVRGFDPTTLKYKYEVNPRFGASRTSVITIRQPVNLSVSLRFDVGPFRERQTLDQYLSYGRTAPGSKYPETLFRSLGTQGMPNPMSTILRAQDDLQLTAMQADSLAAMNRRYTYRVDSLWTPVARHFFALPNEYNEDEAFDAYIRARRNAADLLEAIGPVVKDLLTAEQLRKVPVSVQNMLDPRYLVTIRNGTSMYLGGGGGGGMSFTSGPIMRESIMMGSGGAVMIIR